MTIFWTLQEQARFMAAARLNVSALPTLDMDVFELVPRDTRDPAFLSVLSQYTPGDYSDLNQNCVHMMWIQ